jgi:hypothetical protein
MREGHQRRIQPPGDVVHRGVAGRRPALVLGDLGGLAVDHGDAWRRAPQRQALDQQHQLVRQATLAAVAACFAGKAGQPGGTVARQPALHGPQRHARLRGHAGERHAVVQVRLEHLEARHRGGPLLLGERNQWRCRAGRLWCHRWVLVEGSGAYRLRVSGHGTCPRGRVTGGDRYSTVVYSLVLRSGSTSGGGCCPGGWATFVTASEDARLTCCGPRCS